MLLYFMYISLIASSSLVYGKCPDDSSIIAPCGCRDNKITCYTSVTDFDLIFSKLSMALKPNEKLIDKFELYGLNAPNKINANSFADIIFDKIYFYNWVEYVHPDAFSKMYNISSEVSIYANNLDNIIVNILNKFNNLTVMGYESQAKSLPWDSFTKNHDHVTKLEVGSYVTDLNNYTFANFPMLTSLTIFSNYLEHIHPFAFASNYIASTRLDIVFNGSPRFNEDAFEVNSLISTNRPTTIHLQFPETKGFKYLPEQIFLPFLNSNFDNLIELSIEYKDPKTSHTFDCQDCRSYWLKKHNMLNRLWEVACSNGNTLNNPDNFKDCV